MIRPREEFLNRGSCVMYSEERRRRRNIKTCCVSLEMAVTVFLKTWCTPSRVVFLLLLLLLFFFFFFFKVQIQREAGTVRIGLIMVLRTMRSDRGSHGSLFFSHKAVLEAKRTAKMNGLRFSRSDCTVRYGFQNLAFYKLLPPIIHF